MSRNLNSQKTSLAHQARPEQNFLAKSICPRLSDVLSLQAVCWFVSWSQVFKSWIALSTGWIAILWMSTRKTNCVTHWIVIYPSNRAIHPLNNWAWSFNWKGKVACTSFRNWIYRIKWQRADWSKNGRKEKLITPECLILFFVFFLKKFYQTGLV